MNPIYLVIRTDAARDKWDFNPVPFDSYHDAILAGQEIAPRNFMVDTGSRVPTRKEQLLHDNVREYDLDDPADFQPKPRRGRPSRTKQLIDEL